MPARRPSSWLGSPWTLAVVVTVGVMATWIPENTRLSWISGAMLVVGLLAVAAILLQVLLRFLQGRRCPNCGDSTLARIPSYRSRVFLFQCRSCGLFWRRSLLLGWCESDAPSTEAAPQRPLRRDPWTDVSLDELPEIAEGTHGALLRQRRARQQKTTRQEEPDTPTAESESPPAQGP